MEKTLEQGGEGVLVVPADVEATDGLREIGERAFELLEAERLHGITKPGGEMFGDHGESGRGG